MRKYRHIEFTPKTIATTTGNGYAVVSGGAKGIDSISAVAALSEGSALVSSNHGYFFVKPRLELRPRTAHVAEYTSVQPVYSML